MYTYRHVQSYTYRHAVIQRKTLTDIQTHNTGMHIDTDMQRDTYTLDHTYTEIHTNKEKDVERHTNKHK